MSSRTRCVAVAVYAWMLALAKRCLSWPILAVFLAEVVAPMADAMRFVDGEGADVQPVEQGLKVWREQTVRGRRRRGRWLPVAISASSSRMTSCGRLLCSATAG